MALVLHYFSGSPFVWRVMLALEHKRIPHELHELDASKGEHKSAAFVALNPRGKVPVVVHDGHPIYESAAIVEYLEDCFPDAPRLFPEDVRERAAVRRTIAETDFFLWPCSLQVGRNVYFKNKEHWDEVEISEGKQKLVRELDRVESGLTSNFLCGSAITAADYALYPLLAVLPRLDARDPRLFLGRHIGVKTRAWQRRIEALPYFDRTYPPHWR